MSARASWTNDTSMKRNATSLYYHSSYEALQTSQHFDGASSMVPTQRPLFHVMRVLPWNSDGSFAYQITIFCWVLPWVNAGTDPHSSDLTWFKWFNLIQLDYSTRFTIGFTQLLFSFCRLLGGRQQWHNSASCGCEGWQLSGREGAMVPAMIARVSAVLVEEHP